MKPLGRTIFGVTAWAVLSGRVPGQRTGLRHLSWGGPGDAIHLHADGIADGNTEYPGRDIAAVSGPCQTVAQAQQAVDAYLLGLAQERAGTPARAQGAADETARMLAESGTPEQRCDYALTEAGQRKREAYAAAREQCVAAGSTTAAKRRYVAAYEAARARWAAEVASAVARYAGEIDATAAAADAGADDPASPYSQGWSNGAGMLMPEIVTHRPGGYGDSQWREFVAGYAEAAQLHAEAAAAYSRAVQEQVQESPVESPPGAEGALDGDGTAPGPGGGPAAARPDLEPGWSDGEPNPYGPCYQRYVPGKGILRVTSLGEPEGGYSWYLGLGRPAELIWAPGGRFARPAAAMRDADRQVAGRPPGLWEPLTPGEARLLYVKLSGAGDLEGTRRPGLGTALDDLFTQIRIQALDPGYDGPDPLVIRHEAALRGYAAQVGRAWREGDTGFLGSHSADLDAASPAGRRGGLTPRPSLGFPDSLAKGVPGRSGASRRAPSQPGGPAPGRTP